MDFPASLRKRDARLLRLMLERLRMALADSPTGSLPGRLLMDGVDAAAPEGQGTNDERHALGLIRDLVNKGLASEELLTRRKGQLFGIDFVRVKITAKGSALLNESIDADPDIDDERILE